MGHSGHALFCRMHRASCGFMPPCGITETLFDVESVRAVHMMADMFELPSVALLVVSDNSASGAALVGRTEEQQKQYDFGRMVVLPDMVLTLAKK